MQIMEMFTNLPMLFLKNPRTESMIIEFSKLGAGEGKQTDLCGECKYTLKIQRHNYPPTISWLTGEQIKEQYGSRDVKITVQAIKRCHRHAARNPTKAAKPAFLEAALRSGIDVYEDVDKYRQNILKARHR